jgi:hypothetical protein
LGVVNFSFLGVKKREEIVWTSQEKKGVMQVKCVGGRQVRFPAKNKSGWCEK